MKKVADPISLQFKRRVLYQDRHVGRLSFNVSPMHVLGVTPMHEIPGDTNNIVTALIGNSY